MTVQWLPRIITFLCVLGASSVLVAEPIQETSTRYKQLFSHERKYQPHPARSLALRLGAQVGIGADPRYRLFVQGRAAILDFGVGFTNSVETDTDVAWLMHVAIFKINGYGLYISAGGEYFKSSFYSGVGLSIPLGWRTDLQIEGNYYKADEQGLGVAGLYYQLL